MAPPQEVDLLTVPVVDIGALMACETDAQVEATLQDPAGPFRDTIAALRSAAVEWGFFYITNHGVAPAQLEAFQRAMRAFFALSKDVKNSIRRTVENSRGYFDGELTKNKLDWKEIFDFAGRHEDGPPDDAVYRRMGVDQNQWLPEDVLPGFRDTMRAYSDQMEHIGRRLLMLFAVTLGERFDFFDQFYQSSPSTRGESSVAGASGDNSDDSSSSSNNNSTNEPRVLNSALLRLNYYPVAPDPESTMGLYHHTDPGALTVLLQDDEVASLQVFHRGSQQWLFVPPIKDTFVINIGDMVQIWSNDKFVAPVHRVLASGERERYSAPYFYHPSYEAVVRPVIVDAHEKPLYRGLTWREFMTKRVAGNYKDLGLEVQIEQYRLDYAGEAALDGIDVSAGPAAADAVAAKRTSAAAVESAATKSAVEAPAVARGATASAAAPVVASPAVVQQQA